MAGQGFSVDTSKLLEVADQVHQLRQDLAGESSAAGSLPMYRSKADASMLKSALAPFWVGEDVFSSAYGREHTGIVETMGSMLTQLDALEKACRSTAEQYSNQEQTSKTQVRQTEPEVWT